MKSPELLPGYLSRRRLALRSVLWGAAVAMVLGLPVAGVLWFMGEAVGNERLAVQQRFVDACKPSLEQAASKINSHWKDAAETTVSGVRAVERFHDLVLSGACDSVLINSTSGSLDYPNDQVVFAELGEGLSADWADAEKLEFADKKLKEAAELYRAISETALTTRTRILALAARARCFSKDGQDKPALDLLLGPLSGDESWGVKDFQGNLVSLNSRLLAIQDRLVEQHANADKKIGGTDEVLCDCSDLLVLLTAGVTYTLTTGS